MTADASNEVRFTVRPMRAEDEGFVCSGFMRGLHSSDHVRGIPDDAFNEIFKQQWALVLQHFTVSVAHPEGQQDETAGFIAYRGRVVAWIYVKRDPWRGLGVAKMLMEHAGLRKDGRVIWALFTSGRALSRARASGYRIETVPHLEAIRLLLGVA